jgi:hypothetical protein
VSAAAVDRLVQITSIPGAHISHPALGDRPESGHPEREARRMALVQGVHNAQPINQIPWSTPPNSNFEDWWNPDVPVFVGRYFGPVASQPNRVFPWYAWKDGESKLNPHDQFLKFVCAFQGITNPRFPPFHAAPCSTATRW